VGTNKTPYFICPAAGSFTEWLIAAKSGPAGADLITDINKATSAGGALTSIFGAAGDQPKIAVGSTENTGSTFAAPGTFAKADVLTVDIDQIGSTAGSEGQDVTLLLKGTLS
jgi:hypothetical protein